MTLSSYITLKKNAALGIITLNRPAALNATDYEMIKTIDYWLNDFEADDNIKHIAIMSGVDRAFCAGGDIKAIYHHLNALNAIDSTQTGFSSEVLTSDDFSSIETYFAAEYALVHRLATFAKPIYSFIDGMCFGGGMGLSVHGTARIAAEGAQFSMPETLIGFFPDVGAIYFFNQFNDSREGLYYAITGNRFNACQALRNGIATHRIDKHDWPAVVHGLSLGFDLDELAYNLADMTTEPAIFDTATADPLNEAETSNEIDIAANILSAFSQPSLPEIITALPDDFDALKNKSPLSMAVTFEYMQRFRSAPLETVIKMDLIVAINFIKHGEFKEGVRALLIDKDRNPQWSYAGSRYDIENDAEKGWRESLVATVESIPKSVVDGFFV